MDKNFRMFRVSNVKDSGAVRWFHVSDIGIISIYNDLTAARYTYMPNSLNIFLQLILNRFFHYKILIRFPL